MCSYYLCLLHKNPSTCSYVLFQEDSTGVTESFFFCVCGSCNSTGVDKPVSYFSKKLNKHQKVYSTIEKETLGLVLALQHFEVYLTSASDDITVFTDHNPLVFLDKFKTKSQRLFRWSLLLQPYSLKIVHLAGKDNVIADTLSRV